MGSVPAINGVGNKRLTELNHHMRNEPKEVRDKVVGEGEGFSGENESRIYKVSEDVKFGCERAIQAQTVVQNPQQQPQEPVVRWEKFLPLRSLKVLLVENDDSTRHIVSALLRNCSYEVTAVANGIQAWKILEDLTNHIDLVLTEIFIPYLSGVGLLSKIMSHKRNIPVIMMSSHDSRGIVFKCLSKGAVDFLVKPIRKNELKNIWQHVWRRCHSSSGSGSESGIQTQKSVKSKSVEESENNTGSNDEDDSESIGLNVRDGSDNGSGTQSSWTKRAVEVDSPQDMSPSNQSGDPPDSTCARFIHTKPEAFDSECVPASPIAKHREQEEQLDDIAMGKDLEIGVSSSKKVSINITGTMQDKLPELGTKKDSEKLHKATDLMNVITNGTDPYLENRVSESTNDLSKISEIKDNTTIDHEELPSLELSLKRPRGVRDVGPTTDDRNVLRHSDLSAFSRYNTFSTACQAPTGNVGSCSFPRDNSSELLKTESLNNFPFQSNGNPPNLQSNGSSSNTDMGSTSKNIFTKSAAFNDQHPSAFQPVQNGSLFPSQHVTQEKESDGVDDEVLEQPRDPHKQVQVQHHHHHYHHYHHHLHNMQQQPTDHNEFSLKNMAAVAAQCGSSNMLGGPIEGNALNYSFNGSASGSNRGSNTAINTGINVESDDGVAGKGGSCGISGNNGSGSGSGSGVDQNRFAQREAALTKFRQKRKERCFEKKVRYQSRKKLAEQRPRIRGQFVRQTSYEHKNQEADS